MTGCPSILGNIQPDSHFLCRLLTIVFETEIPAANDLLPISEGFLNGSLL